MDKRNIKYRGIVEVLRRKKPTLDSAEDLSREVISRISSSFKPEPASFSIVDLLYGWTEVVWIRRSLIAFSFLLVTLFIHQQSMILKQVNWLSKQVVINNEKAAYSTNYEFGRRFKLLKISGSKIPGKEMTISDEKVEMLMESLEKLQSDYTTLMKIIQDDPELKELIEKRLDELNYPKVKL